MSTVDYSGGTIITDWYTDDTNENKSIKITLDFINRVKADSLKIIVHQKNCSNNNNCKIQLQILKLKVN